MNERGLEVNYCAQICKMWNKELKICVVFFSWNDLFISFKTVVTNAYYNTNQFLLGT